jgi:hypothetical protein
MQIRIVEHAVSLWQTAMRICLFIICELHHYSRFAHVSATSLCIWLCLNFWKSFGVMMSILYCTVVPSCWQTLLDCLKDFVLLGVVVKGGGINAEHWCPQLIKSALDLSSAKGGIWQPLPAACLQDAPCPFWHDTCVVSTISGVDDWSKLPCR